MKVVHIESGLGNQMLSFCEYIALKKSNPNDDIYIETIIYDIPECEKYISQWNGYELDEIFGLNIPNVRECFSENTWKHILNDIRATRFWEKNWNYPVYFTQIFAKYGLELVNIRGDFETPGFPLINVEANSIKSKLGKTMLGYYLKCLIKKKNEQKILSSVNHQDIVFFQTEENIFTGQRLCMKNLYNGIERIDSEIEEIFQFPTLKDDKNREILKIIQQTNSVAIHVRRGDMLGWNGVYYRYGYFKRAVRYIMTKVSNPVFIFFCDPGSVEWCRNNETSFGLDFKKDKVFFVDWNKGKESFRDMQLMSECKHAIITNSSFGWWGAYFIKNPEKITCSPELQINTTMHFV